jgi:hypothetical protein
MQLIGPVVIRVRVLQRSRNCRTDICTGKLDFFILQPADRNLGYIVASQLFEAGLPWFKEISGKAAFRAFLVLVALNVTGKEVHEKKHQE